MRAVLIACEENYALKPLSDHRPSALLRIVDRPIIFHILDRLSKVGITKVDLVLHHHADQIEESIGSGSRWGLEISVHLTKNSNEPFSTLKYSATTWENEDVLIGSVDTLPDQADLQCLIDSPGHLSLVDEHGASLDWGKIASSDIIGSDRSTNLTALFSSQTSASAEHAACCVSNFENYLNANRTALDTAHNFLFPSAVRKGDNNCWVGRGSTIHPSSKIIPPVFLGENVEVKENVVLGPNVVVENHCVIDSTSVLRDTVIAGFSYVGEGLSLENTLVDRNLLISVEHSSGIHVEDDFILCELRQHRISDILFNMFERLVAGLILLLAAPLLFIQAYQTKYRFTPVLQLPCAGPETQRKTCTWLRNLVRGNTTSVPLFNLYHVVRGHAHLVGVAPRTASELASVPEDWQHLYKRSKIGILTLDRMQQNHVSREDTYSSEAYYACHASPRFDLGVCAKFLRMWARWN